MAESADIIKEFLVALGFKIDQTSLNKFDSGIAKATKGAFVFAGVMAGMATVATAVVEKVANKMEGLYWSSVRLRDGAANIQDFQLELSKVGGTADGALNSLENMARYLRTNPAGEGLLHNLGVQTRDAQNHLRSTISIVKDFAHLPMPYWLKVRFANRFGIDEQSLQAIIRAAPEASNKIDDLYKRAGINADQAAEASKDFNNKLRDLESVFGVIATVGEVRLLPVLSKFVDLCTTLAGWIIDLDKATDGWSTQLGVLAVAIWGVNTALSVTFGAGIAGLIWKLMAMFSLWAVEFAPALAEGVWAVGAAFAEGLVPGLIAATTAMIAFLATNPVGWAILAASAIGTAAYLIIKNWDKVKAYFGEFVDWFRDKYNAIAKYLGLPQWKDNKTPEEKRQQDELTGAHEGGVKKLLDGGAAGDGTDGNPPANGGRRDFRQEERDLGPQSQYGGQGELTGRALAFFQKAGWTANQAAGIVANLLHESGLNAHATGDHGQAYGVAQWHKDRQADFAAWAGHDIHESSLAEQLAFLNHELKEGKEKRGGALLGAANTAAAAGAVVSRYVERPADTDGQANARARTAAGLVANSRLTGPQGASTNVTIDARTDVKVSGSGDPQAAGRAVGREVGRKNGDLVRDFAGAVSG